MKTVLDIINLLSTLPADYGIKVAVLDSDENISQFEVKSLEISDADKVIIFNNYDIKFGK